MWILGVTFIFHIILKKKVTPWIHRPTPFSKIWDDFHSRCVMQVFMTTTYPQTVADLLYGGRFLLRFSDCVLVDFILDGYVSCLPFLVDLRNIFGLYNSGDRGLIPLSGLKNTNQLLCKAPAYHLLTTVKTWLSQSPRDK